MSKIVDKYTRFSAVFDYKEVEAIFGIKRFPFGRGINVKDDSIVLIAIPKAVDPSSHNYWDNNGDYIYCGEGNTGNQKLIGGNLALANSRKDDKTIHLIIKESAKKYYYQGMFVLVDYTYEPGKDKYGNSRMEYRFRLRRDELCKENDGCDPEIERNRKRQIDSSNEEIFLEWKEGYRSFAIASKHPSRISINNRDCEITYSQGTVVVDTVRKTINKTNYARLIDVFEAWYYLLSTETTPSYIRFPHGGTGNYNYSFRDKSNHNDAASLFEGDEHEVSDAYSSYWKVIDDIVNQ